MNPLREWLKQEITKYLEDKRLNLKALAEQAGVSYYIIYEFVKRGHSLRDDDIAKLLKVLGYDLVPEAKKLTYEVCEVIKTQCQGDLFKVPVYSRLEKTGKPDFSSKVGVACVGENAYCVEISDNRTFPFPYRSIVVAYRQVNDITGDGFYLFLPYGQDVPIVREVKLANGFIIFKLYNPEDIEVLAPDHMESKMKVVGRVIEFTVRVV